MNLLFQTLLYHPSNLAQTLRDSRDGVQNQINNHEWALVAGLRDTLAGTLTVHTALPVGAFPLRYRKPCLPSRAQEPNFTELGGPNLPWLKQLWRASAFTRALETWTGESPENRDVLVYTLYLPFMRAVARAKRRYPDLRAYCVVTDLPNELGVASYRHGLLKRVEYAVGRRRMRACDTFDGFVLLTSAMAAALPKRPAMVMEGLIQPAPDAPDAPAEQPPVVLYTGTLNRELGLGMLLEAFTDMPEYQLWLCGKTDDMASELESAARLHPNIRYFGYVPQEQALALQARASALINPRPSIGAFTRYSFPSKTLEYLRAGKPVLCCKLPGIPSEYDAYLRYFATEDAQGVRDAVRALFALPPAEREAIGRRGRDFALNEKNARAQCKRLVAFIADQPRGAASR